MRGLSYQKSVLGQRGHQAWAESMVGLGDRVVPNDEVPEQFRPPQTRAPCFPHSVWPWREAHAGARALGAGNNLPTLLALLLTVPVAATNVTRYKAGRSRQITRRLFLTVPLDGND